MPLRWTDEGGVDELAEYVRPLATRVRVIVVDGCPEPLFSAHAHAFARPVRHVRPDWPGLCRNGKVCGVLTGVRLAEPDKVVIADEDVRYDDTALTRIERLLDRGRSGTSAEPFRPRPVARVGTWADRC